MTNPAIMTNLAIAATGLRKSYSDKDGDKVVLDGIDLAVPEGTIFSLLGPNGAGKTTTVQILSTPKHLPKREGKQKAKELLEQFDLVDAARKPASTYSGGMQRRLISAIERAAGEDIGKDEKDERTV
jgi:ABC-2 type transport system ATP-binding protein